MKQWAITVGINQYQFFQPLSYAQRDAQVLHNLLIDEVGFAAEQCLLMTDTSPSVWGKPTHPSRENIQGWIDLLSQQYLQPGDLLWYFFSGYGVCHQGQDYLMPIEGNPGAIDATAIPVEMLFNRLQRIPTDSLLVLLDVNRNQSSMVNETVGTQTAQLANQSGISTILSCQPGQFSREAADLRHGFFTAALLESLRSHNCTTMAALDHYLSDRVPQLSEQYWRPIQQPLIISAPEKINQIILPNAAANGRVRSTLSLAQPNTLGAAAQSTTNGVSRSLTLDPSATLATNQVNGSVWADTNKNPSIANGASQNGSVSANGVIANDLSANGLLASHNGHNDPATSTPPRPSMTPPPNDPQDLETALDRVFWKRAILVGGLTVAALLLGVVFRNWTALTQGTPTAAPSETKLPTPSERNQTPEPPSPRVSSGSSQANKAGQPRPIAPNQGKTTDAGQPVAGTTEPTVPAPISGLPQTGKKTTDQIPFDQPQTSNQPQTKFSQQAIAPSLETTKSKLKLAVVNSDQASPFWYAIQDASKIPPEHPQYKEAQKQITLWSQEIFNIARRRARRRNFDGAIVAAVLVPGNQAIARSAKQSLGRWCPSLATQTVGNPTQRRRAKSLCRQM